MGETHGGRPAANGPGAVPPGRGGGASADSAGPSSGALPPPDRASGRVPAWTRAVSLGLSLVLHALAASWFLNMAWPLYAPLTENVYQVDIVQEEPEPEMASLPPESVEPPPVSRPRPKPTLAAQISKPPKPPKSPKAAQVRPAPQPPPGPLVAETEDLPTLDQARIPRGAVPVSPAPEPAPPPPPEADKDRSLPGVYTRGDDATVVGGLRGFAGMADTFALERLAADVFTEDEYVGHYRTRGGEFLSVVDTRKSLGRMILYDSVSGFCRALTRYGSMIYTYGPTFHAAEPVAGTMYLMPKKQRTGDANIDMPSQIIWMPAKPPMHYGQKVAFRTQNVTVRGDGPELSGMVVSATGEPAPGVVLIPGVGCAPAGLSLGMARTLAMRGLTVLVMDMRGCGGSGGDWKTSVETDLARDVRAGVRLLRGHAWTTGRSGVWGRDRGGLLAIKAAARGGADFVVRDSARDDPDCRVPPPNVPDLMYVDAPLLWMRHSGESRDCRERAGAVIDRLAAGQDKDFRIMDLESDGESRDDPEAVRWLRRLGMRQADLGAKWIHSLD